MADYLPKFNHGDPFTLTASAAVTGGRVVVVSGAGTVAEAGADAAVLSIAGVAAFDAELGEAVTVYPLGGSVHLLTAGAPVAAGATVATLATGKVDDTGTNKFGVALDAATADGDVIAVIC